MKYNLDINKKDIDIDLDLSTNKDFWGFDVGTYLNNYRNITKRRKNDNNNPLIESVMSNTFWSSKISDSNFVLEEDKPKEKNHLESSANINNESILDKNKDTSQSINQLSVSSDEMNDLRDIYIAGNISGENIYDLEGRIIVKRNEKITKDIIKKTEISGKLSELILNMKLNNFEKSL